MRYLDNQINEESNINLFLSDKDCHLLFEQGLGFWFFLMVEKVFIQLNLSILILFWNINTNYPWDIGSEKTHLDIFSF